MALRFAIWGLLAWTAAAVPAAGELLPVPRPPAGSVEAVVAQELAAAHAAVDAAGRDELAGAYGELGRLCAAYELWDAAAAAFANAHQLAPEDFAWAYLLGYVEGQRSRPQAAVAALETATRLRPGDAAAWLRLGEAHLALGDARAARRAFERARRDAPAAAHFGLGRAAARLGDHAAAAEHFEQALRHQPAASQVRVPLAMAYRRTGRAEEARRQLAQRGERRVGFDDPLVAGLAAGARGGALYKFRGDQAVLDGRLHDAVADYRRAVAADPTSFFYRKSLALTLNRLGDARAAAAELEAAEPLLASLDPAQRDAEAVELHYALGALAVNRGDAAAARARFETAVALDPSYADAWLQLGNLEGRAGRLEAALAYFDRAVEADPDHAPARLQRATTLMDLGRFAAAIPDLERRLDLQPQDPQARQLLAIARQRAGRG
ncbi:MAG: tetratricopeptide repeat protein, partial [Acidobacteria bacterium]